MMRGLLQLVLRTSRGQAPKDPKPAGDIGVVRHIQPDRRRIRRPVSHIVIVVQSVVDLGENEDRPDDLRARMQGRYVRPGGSIAIGAEINRRRSICGVDRGGGDPKDLGIHGRRVTAGGRDAVLRHFLSVRHLSPRTLERVLEVEPDNISAPGAAK